MLAALAGLVLLVPGSAGAAAPGVGLTAAALAEGLGPAAGPLTAHDLATFLFRLGTLELGTSTPLAAAVKAGLLPSSFAGHPGRAVSPVVAVGALAAGLGVEASTPSAEVALLQRLGDGPIPPLTRPWTLGTAAGVFAHGFQSNLSVETLLANQLTGALPATEKLDGTFVLNLRGPAGSVAKGSTALKNPLALALVGLSLTGAFSVEARNPSGPARVGMTMSARVGSKRRTFTLIGITSGAMAYVYTSGPKAGWHRVPVKNPSGGVPLAPILSVASGVLTRTHVHLLGSAAGLDRVGFSARLASTRSLLESFAHSLGSRPISRVGGLPPADVWGLATLDAATGRMRRLRLWVGLPSDPGLGLMISNVAAYGVPVSVTVPPAARSAPLEKGSVMTLLP